MRKRIDIRAASLTPTHRAYMLALHDQDVRRRRHSALDAVATAFLIASAASVFWLAWIILA